MQDIEPFYNWRHLYIASEDEHSPFWGHANSEFQYSNTIYNYFIHPQWDNFGSETLFYKLLYADYEQQFCVIEFIGEWNDAINNDVMQLKGELIDHLIDSGIRNFALIFENVINFHADIEDYYQEWKEDIEGGIYVINALPHVIDELKNYNLQHSLSFGGWLNDVNWRKSKPDQLLELLER